MSFQPNLYKLQSYKNRRIIVIGVAGLQTCAEKSLVDLRVNIAKAIDDLGCQKYRIL